MSEITFGNPNANHIDGQLSFDEDQSVIRKGTRVRHKLVGWEGKVISTDRTAMTPKALVDWSHGRTHWAPLDSLEKIS